MSDSNNSVGSPSRFRPSSSGAFTEYCSPKSKASDDESPKPATSGGSTGDTVEALKPPALDKARDADNSLAEPPLKRQMLSKDGSFSRSPVHAPPSPTLRHRTPRIQPRYRLPARDGDYNPGYPYVAPTHEITPLQRRRVSDVAAPLGTGAPPCDTIHIPLATAAHQGHLNLSSEDWKCLYLTSQHELSRAQRHAHMFYEENRVLKRRLIELQRHLYRSRRERRSGSTHRQQPWTVPSNPQNGETVRNQPVAAAAGAQHVPRAVSRDESSVFDAAAGRAAAPAASLK